MTTWGTVTAALSGKWRRELRMELAPPTSSEGMNR